MFEIRNRETHLKFSSENGAVSCMEFAGRIMNVGTERAFLIRLLSAEGDYVMLDDRDFHKFLFDGKILRWSDCVRFPGLEMKETVRKSEGGGVRFRPSLSGIPAGFLPDFISAPLIGIPLQWDFLLPRAEGGIFHYTRYVQDAWEEHLTFQSSINGIYPGFTQMQFLAASLKNAGIYFSADDFTHSIKFLGSSHEKNKKSVELHIECTCGTEKPGPDYELPYDLILRPFVGDWQNACEIYRNWVRRDPAMKREFPLPKWLNDSPVVIIYPVRGDKTIKAQTNRLLPYERAFPYIEKLADKFQSRVLALISRWDHNGPWLPPYYWPPVGGAKSFRKFAGLLHNAGHLLGVYGSGISFTLKSLTTDYSGENIFKHEHFEDSVILSPKGSMSPRKFQEIRTDVTFCICEEAIRKILEEQTRILATEKLDFFQFLDQNLGGYPDYCYSKSHHHPAVPGKASTEAMRDFLKHLNVMIRTAGSEMILGTECAAAGPFVAGLPFNDLRSQFVDSEDATPIHAYQYVFHRYTNNFFGNQCLVTHNRDNDYMRFHIARGFCGGSLMTVTLRDSGEIDWGAASCEWTEPAPDQESVITFIRNLNEMRKRNPGFLQKGDMITPPRIECGMIEFSSPVKTETVPEIVCSAWCAPNGRRKAFFVNYGMVEKKFRWDGKCFSVPPLDVINIPLNRSTKGV